MTNIQAQVALQDGIIRRAERQRHLFEKCLKNLKHIVEDFSGTDDKPARFEPGTLDQDTADKILGIAQKVVTAQQSLEDQKKAMRMLKEALVTDSNERGGSSTEEESDSATERGMDHLANYHNKLRETKNERAATGADQYKTDDSYRQLNSAIRRMINPESASDPDDFDASMTATETRVSVKDPISQKPIKDPVRNIFCRHAFDRKTILDYLARMKKLKKPAPKCPHIGCNNQEPLKPEDLEDYPELLQQEGAHRDDAAETSSVDLLESSAMDTE